MSAPDDQISTVLFTNEIGILFSDNDVQIQFSVQGQPRAVQARMAMTHRTAKVLCKTLERMLADFEEATGLEVPYDQTKLDDLFSEAKAKALADSIGFQPPSGQSLSVSQEKP